MYDAGSVLNGLRGESAKQRERTIKSLSPEALQDAQVVEQLQVLVSADPVQYVREAAKAQLLAAGQTPRESIVNVQLKDEGVGKPAVFAIGCMVIPIACVIVAILAIAILAVLGPQIGTVFSRITNGLAGSP